MTNETPHGIRERLTTVLITSLVFLLTILGAGAMLLVWPGLFVEEYGEAALMGLVAILALFIAAALARGRYSKIKLTRSQRRDEYSSGRRS